MNVLFLTSAALQRQVSGDASTRYRCFNVAEVLRKRGHRADVHALDGFSPRMLDRYDVVSVLRPQYCPKLLRVLDQCQRRYIHTVADFDDLLFVPELAENSPQVVNQQNTVHRVRRRFEAHRSVLEYFDEITVSTAPLAAALHAIDEDVRVHLIPNGLSEYTLRQWQSRPLPMPEPNTLSYLPGSHSHDADLASILPALERWLSDNTEHRLQLVGKFELANDALPSALRTQLHSHPWVEYAELAPWIAQSQGTLAPLVDNPFNHAKSHVKFIESAALGVPLLASCIPDLEQHRVDGLLLARDSEDWAQLLPVLADPDYRHHCQSILQNHVREHAMAYQYSDALIKHWELADRHSASLTRKAS